LTARATCPAARMRSGDTGPAHAEAVVSASGSLLTSCRMPRAYLRKRLACSWHRYTGNLELDTSQRCGGRNIQRLPVCTAPGNIGRMGHARQNGAQVFARSIHDPHPSRSCTIHMPFHIDLHPIRDPSPFSPQLAEDPAIGQHAIGPDFERPDMPDTSEDIL